MTPRTDAVMRDCEATKEAADRIEQLAAALAASQRDLEEEKRLHQSSKTMRVYLKGQLEDRARECDDKIAENERLQTALAAAEADRDRFQKAVCDIESRCHTAQNESIAEYNAATDAALQGPAQEQGPA